MSGGWQEREAYFAKHGPNPKQPYVDKSDSCGCVTIWKTPAMGAGYKCRRCQGLAEQEMAQSQSRRRAHFVG